jgi:D-psicose/D-tagatose/L-ribulose 3-epimerase
MKSTETLTLEQIQRNSIMENKVKYGAHCFLWIEKWDNKHLGLLNNSRQLGLDVFEIAIGDDVDFRPADIKNAAGDAEVEIVISPGGDWPMEADISPEDVKKQQTGLNWHKKWMEKGAEAGAVAYTGAIYGHPGYVRKAAPSQKEFETITKNLRILAEFASGLNMKLVLEPMSHFRTHIANTPEQLMRLISGTGHPNLFVLLDTYHLVTEVRNYVPGIYLMKDHLWGVHACENDRGVPGGGLVPWDSIFGALKEINYNGYMILETYNSGINSGDFAYSRAMFHDVCPNGNDFVKAGLHFLKSKW